MGGQAYWSRQEYDDLADALDEVTAERDALRAAMADMLRQAEEQAARLDLKRRARAITPERLDEVEATWGDGMEINFGGQS